MGLGGNYMLKKARLRRSKIDFPFGRRTSFRSIRFIIRTEFSSTRRVLKPQGRKPNVPRST